MKEFVAVVPAFNLLNPDQPVRPPSKKEALVFDRIAIPNFQIVHDMNFGKAVDPTALKELVWLYENGIVVNPVEMLPPDWQEKHSEEVERYHKAFNTETRNMFELLKRREKSQPVDEDFMPIALRTFDIDARRDCARLREYAGLDAHPLLQNLLDVPSRKASKSDLLQIVLKRFPIPSDITPWEQILEFRSDPESQKKFLRLREWMSEVARMELTQSEAEERLESLMAAYRDHMKVHKMKTGLSSIKTVLCSEATVVGGSWIAGAGPLPGLIGMVGTSLYTIIHRQVTLMEEEQRAPGKEVAYIDAARTTFER